MLSEDSLIGKLGRERTSLSRSAEGLRPSLAYLADIPLQKIVKEGADSRNRRLHHVCVWGFGVAEVEEAPKGARYVGVTVK
jgi:hypothetical protein